jgi:bacterioferritin-associated ferredoxin
VFLRGGLQVNLSGDHEAASHRVRRVLANCSFGTSCGGHVKGARSVVREEGANKGEAKQDR